MKKLRLIQRPAPTEVNLDLQGSQSSQDALNRLLRFQDDLVDGCNISASILRELLDHFQREKEAVVRGKVAQVLGQLGRIPQFNTESLVEDVIMLLNGESKSFCAMLLCGLVFVR